MILVRDPIVEEIHAIRRDLDKRYSGNLEQICRSLRKREKHSQRKFAALPLAKKPEAA